MHLAFLQRSKKDTSTNIAVKSVNPNAASEKQPIIQRKKKHLRPKQFYQKLTREKPQISPLQDTRLYSYQNECCNWNHLNKVMSDAYNAYIVIWQYGSGTQ